MLTTGEVAKLFHVSAQTVINWLDQGRMPYERIGRGPRRLTEEAVMRYVEEIGISPEALDEEIYARATKAAAAYRNATGPAVVVTDAELKVIAWNEASRTLYGHTQVEMLGKPLSKIVSKINGSDSPLDNLVRAPWQDKSLQIEAQQETRYGKQLTGIMTVSRFYMDGVLAGFVRGQLTVCLTLGIYYAGALMAAGLQFGLIVGAIAGVITVIPFVGALFGGALAMGIALYQFWGDWLHIGLIAVIFGFGQFMEGNVLTPRLVGKSVGLHPVWLMLALSIFGAIFGFAGLLVAVPVAASFGVVARFALARYRESPLYQGVTGSSDDGRLL